MARCLDQYLFIFKFCQQEIWNLFTSQINTVYSLYQWQFFVAQNISSFVAFIKSFFTFFKPNFLQCYLFSSYNWSSVSCGGWKDSVVQKNLIYSEVKPMEYNVIKIPLTWTSIHVIIVSSMVPPIYFTWVVKACTHDLFSYLFNITYK